MKVTVDEEECLLPDGATLGDALKAAGVDPQAGSVIGVVVGRGEKAKETNSYWLETTKGKMRIEVIEGGLEEAWHGCVGSIGGSSALWSSQDAVSFGTFPAGIAPGRAAHEYNRWEVVLGTSGFEADRSQLIIILRRHSAAYGAPEGRGVFARVVGGKSTIDRLDEGDRILGVEPIVEWEDLTDKMVTQDRSIPLSEGMEIFTRVWVDLTDEAPHGAEFFLASAMSGTFVVAALSSSYIASDLLLGEPIEFEHREPRLEGSVSIRTKGRGLGRIFIYKADRTSHPNHSVVGRVQKGMDLVKLVEPGQAISVTVRPERIMLMGRQLSEARATLEDRGIVADIEGFQGDGAMVIGQDPGTTLEILAKGRVSLKAIEADRLVAIELFDDLAPKTLDYFRHVVGLKERPVGPLPVFFVYENTVLFQPTVDARRYKELLPENKPTEPVPAGMIAVSNQVAKKIGLVGVKMIEDRRFGPSGEKFEATNIIGRVLDLEKLNAAKEGDTIYVLEVK
ncbi:MAG: methanogenesis marker 3 protein [Methanotrichaceae archaeon]|nr:methanogenesis marker 3 protein [Methanotrichaceae archaeon]